MKNFKIMTLMTVLLWLSRADLVAQEKESLDLGSRIRVTAAPVTTSKIVGTLTAWNGDTLFLHMKNALPSTPLAIPRTAITRLEVSRGKGSRGESALTGAVIGLSAGAAATFIVLEASAAKFDLGDDSIFLGSVIGGAGGLVIGGSIGSLLPRTRWETIPLERVDVKTPLSPTIQRHEKKNFLFIVGGIGAGNTTKSSEERSGINTAVRLGLNLSQSFALSLDYEINDRRDEKPLSTDHIKNRDLFISVRNPRVFSTRYTFISIQINLKEGFYIRPSLGLGFHRFAIYTPVYGAIDPTTRWPTIERYDGEFSSEGGPAYGLAAGYELIQLRALSFGLEGTYRKSRGEDSSGSRRAVGMQGLVALKF